MTTTDKLVAEVRRLDAAAPVSETAFPNDAGLTLAPSAKVGFFMSRAELDCFIACRTAAPALADAVERRDAVIAEFCHALECRLVEIYTSIVGKAEVVRYVHQIMTAERKIELVGGKWRIRERAAAEIVKEIGET